MRTKLNLMVPLNVCGKFFFLHVNPQVKGWALIDPVCHTVYLRKRIRSAGERQRLHRETLKVFIQSTHLREQDETGRGFSGGRLNGDDYQVGERFGCPCCGRTYQKPIILRHHLERKHGLNFWTMEPLDA